MAFALLLMFCAIADAQVPPTIAKSFLVATMPLNSSTMLTLTVTNPNAATAFTGVAFSDTLPSGLIIANPDSLSSSCDTSLISLTATSISLSGGTMPVSSSCTYTIDVLATTAGTKVNTTGNVSSTEGGTGNTATASVIVTTAPSITTSFSPTAVVVNGTVTLSFVINNIDPSTAQTAVAFSDSLPAGLVVATPNGLSSTCGGTVTATAGSSSVSLAGGTLSAGGSCTISVNITATTPGIKANTTGQVSSTPGGTGATSNTANLEVVQPPTLAKAFGAASVGPGGTTSLTFTVTDSDSSVNMLNMAFTDTLPSGLVVATPNGLTGTCLTVSGSVLNAATVGANAGSGTISMSALSLAAAGSCTFAVNVTALPSAGASQVNTTSNITATVDDGTGTFVGITGGTATATLSVLVPDLTVTKSHTGNFAQGQTGATYTITVTNVGAAPTSGTVTLTDTLPTGLTATAISGTGWTCPTLTSCNRSDVLAASGSYPAITLTVSVALSAPASVINTATVSGGGDTNTANNTANDTTTITPSSGGGGPSPITITIINGSATVTAGHLATFTLLVTSADPSTLGPLNFTCSNLPRGTSCDFDKQGEAQASTQVTLSISTSIQSSSVEPFGFGRSAPLYAALVFPLLGLVLLGAGGQREKHIRPGKMGRARSLKLWLGMFLGGLLLLLAGCGENTPDTSTPSGSYAIKVTATSSTNPAVNTSATVNLTVR